MWAESETAGGGRTPHIYGTAEPSEFQFRNSEIKTGRQTDRQTDKFLLLLLLRRRGNACDSGSVNPGSNPVAGHTFSISLPSAFFVCMMVL